MQIKYRRMRASITRKHIVGLVIFVVAFSSLFLLIGLKSFSPSELTSAVTSKADFNIDECVERLQMTNPSISEKNARNNCYYVTAISTKDPNLCSKITSTYKSNCLGQASN